MNKLIKFSATAILLSASLSAVADYQVEGNAAYHTVSYDNYDVSNTLLAVDYYLEAVKTQGVVLNEADFLGKSSSVGGFISKTEVENFDSTTKGLHGRYVFANNYTVEAQANFGEDDYNSYTLAGGKYLNDNTEVQLGFVTSDYADETFFGQVKNISTTSNGKTLNSEAGFSINDGDLAIAGLADYYLDRMLSIGASTTINFQDETTVGLGIHSDVFISETIAFNADISMLDISETDIAFGIGITGRF